MTAMNRQIKLSNTIETQDIIKDTKKHVCE